MDALLRTAQRLGDVALVLIGSGGVVAAICMLGKIKDQAEWMEQQTKIMDQQATLMQAAFDQWINVRDWKVYRKS